MSHVYARHGVLNSDDQMWIGRRKVSRAPRMASVREMGRPDAGAMRGALIGAVVSIPLWGMALVAGYLLVG